MVVVDGCWEVRRGSDSTSNEVRMGGGRGGGLVGGVSEEEEESLVACGEVNRRGERDLGAVKPLMLDIDRD